MKKDHRIASVTFTHNVDGQTAPLTCECQKRMTVGQYPAHRRKVGAPRRTLGDLIQIPVYGEKPRGNLGMRKRGRVVTA